MKAIILVIALTVPTPAVLHAQAHAVHNSRDPFASVLTQIKAKTKIPVFLPTELPKPLCDAKKAVVNQVTPSEYAVSLYCQVGMGDAGLAATFAGENSPTYSPRDLGNVRQVKLSDGIVGFFMPVSCGGSCGPANLWWQKGPLYQVQLRLPSTLSEEEQEKITIAVANSAIAKGPR